MKIHVLKIKLRLLHKYLGFTFSIFILYLTITGLLLMYPSTFKISTSYFKSNFILKKYKMQTHRDVKEFFNPQYEIIIIMNTIYVNKKFIDTLDNPILSADYYNNDLYILNKKQLNIYKLEKIDNSLEIIDLITIKNSENFDVLGRNTKNNKVLLKNETDIYEIDSEGILKRKKQVKMNYVKLSKSIIANKTTAKEYLIIHQGKGVSAQRVITELHNGSFFGSIYTFILFISSLSIIFLTLSSFIFGTNILKRRNK